MYICVYIYIIYIYKRCDGGVLLRTFVIDGNSV